MLNSVTLEFQGRPRQAGLLLVYPMESQNENNGIVTEDVQGQGESVGEGSDRRDFAAGIGEIVADRDRLTKEKAELQDLLQRRQAEFENFRRRTERERSELFEFAASDTVKALLPVLDDFQRALKVETADKEYARGMEMIYTRLLDTLKKLGLEPISSEVPLFNPHIHHAVEMVDTKDHPDQTILEEYQPGYYFKGRLLRPALVKVAVNQ
jgi:molecular chaperone GrpE